MKLFIMKFCYDYIVLPLAIPIAKVYSFFNKKVKQGLKERKEDLVFIEKIKDKIQSKKRKVIIIHSTSAGEFEQARPVIKYIKEKYPDLFVVATFFSPSGYHEGKKTAIADFVCYLPFDAKRSVRQFLNILNPISIVLVKYEVWPNLIIEAARRGIKIYLIDAVIRGTSLRNKEPFKSFYVSLYEMMSGIFTATESEKENIKKIVKNVPVEYWGDTRYDQVLDRMEKYKNKKKVLFDGTINKDIIIVAGSSYVEDENYLLPALKQLKNRYKLNFPFLFIVPHEVDKYRILKLVKRLSKDGYNVLCSSEGNHIDVNHDVVVIDEIGKLAELYSLSDIVFIGGSFKGSVHSVLEPASWGKPIVSGPHIKNAPEALELVKIGAMKSANSTENLINIFSELIDSKDLRKNMGEKAFNLVLLNKGASKRIGDILV